MYICIVCHCESLLEKSERLWYLFAKQCKLDGIRFGIQRLVSTHTSALHLGPEVLILGDGGGVLWTNWNAKSLNLAKFWFGEGGGRVLLTNWNPKSLNLAKF